MVKSNNKIRIVKIIDILREETDEEHPMSTVQLIERLKDEGIDVDRKTLYNDIDVLNEFYTDIECIKKSQNLYYISERDFEDSEIQIIASAVMAAKFIPASQTRNLVDRIYKLTSKWKSEVLRQNITLKNPNKYSNNEIFLNIELIVEAIRTKKKIMFSYIRYDLDKNQNFKNQRISPVDLIYSNDYYYFIGYSFNNNKYYTFRIDKMKNVSIIDEDLEKNTYNSKKYIDEMFSSKTFQMYDAKEEYVKLKIKNNIVGPMIDRFGEKLSINKIDDTWGEIVVLVKTSNTFYSWVLTFEDSIEILEPEWVRNDFISYVNNVINVYKG